jgi:hypothetical protein
MVKMDDMVMLILHTVQQVSYQSGIGRDFYAHGVLNRPHGRKPVDIRAHAAGALHEMLGVSGITSLEYHFDAPEHLTGTPGIFDLAAFDLDLDAKVAFYSCNRVDYDSSTHIVSSLSSSKGLLVLYSSS